MAQIILPDKWKRQPSGRTEVNWSNPIAQNLIAAVPLNDVAHDAASGRLASLTSAPYAKPSRRGMAWYLDGSDDILTIPLPKTYSVPITLVAWFAIDPTSDVFDNTAKIDAPLMLRNGASIYEGFLLQVGNTGGGVAVPQAVMQDDTTGTPYTVNGTTNLWTHGGLWRQYAGVFSSTSVEDIYSNGKYENTISSGSRNPQVNNLLVGVGTHSTGYTHYAKGLVQNVLAFNRALSAGEIRSLYDEPWQLYKRAVPRTYFFPPTRPEPPPAIVLPDKCRKQPLTGKVKINWSSPLTHGLNAAFCATSPNVELVHGERLLVGATLGTKQGQIGFNRTVNSVQYVTPRAARHPIYEPSAGDLTIAALCWQQTESNFGRAITRGNGTQTPAWEVGLSSGSVDGAQGTVRTANGSLLLGPTSITGTTLIPRFVSLSVGTDVWLRMDTSELSGTRPTGDYFYEYDSGYGRTLAMCGMSTSTGTIDVACSFQWLRALGKDEHLELMRNPWQLFTRDPGRVYFYTKPMQPRQAFVTMGRPVLTKQPR